MWFASNSADGPVSIFGTNPKSGMQQGKGEARASAIYRPWSKPTASGRGGGTGMGIGGFVQIRWPSAVPSAKHPISEVSRRGRWGRRSLRAFSILARATVLGSGISERRMKYGRLACQCTGSAASSSSRVMTSLDLAWNFTLRRDFAADWLFCRFHGLPARREPERHAGSPVGAGWVPMAPVRAAAGSFKQEIPMCGFYRRSI